MIRLLFVGDGDRDAATVPPLVEEILGLGVTAVTRSWNQKLHLHGKSAPQAPRGYARKLVYAVRAARSRRLDGVVATVDTDAEEPRSRLAKLQEGRDLDREKAPSLPTALGEANPHSEAWLLDDHVAVREALGLQRDVPIPTVRDTDDPKGALNELMDQSPREIGSGDRYQQLLGAIAAKVTPKRCAHAKKTGFDAFIKDVRDELGRIAHPRTTRDL